MFNDVILDWKYVDLASSRLTGFTYKKRTLAVARCPFCGDSKKDKSKKRFYFYEKSNIVKAKCQNCGYGPHNISFFLNHLDVNLYNDYRLEAFRGRRTSSKEKDNTEYLQKRMGRRRPIQTVKTYSIKPVMININDLNPDHYCREYIESRKIPESQWNRLYFTPDFKQVAMALNPESAKNLRENEPRLVIPFWNKGNIVDVLQGRSFEPDSQLRYITIKKHDDSEKVYGLDRLDSSKPVIVVEGPLDSLFLDNAIATCDSSLHRYQGDIYCYDNQPRNKDLVKLIEHAIEQHLTVTIWPSHIKEKDINDMVLAGYSTDYIQEVIKKYSYCGLEAKLKFSQWRKI